MRRARRGKRRMIHQRRMKKAKERKKRDDKL